MQLNFRALTANDIDVRVATVTEKGCTLLLYKDARVDMEILDETVGATNWQREHTRDNANCVVSIWDDTKSQWISKEDTGTESYTEKEKGLASDSFKRACFNWGIGRELYTAPFIFVNASDVKLSDKNGKKTTYDKFKVSDIAIENKKIVRLSITNERTRKVCFNWTEGNVPTAPVEKPKEYNCCDCGKPFEAFERNGRQYNAGQAYHISESMNTDGKARCGECMKKAGTKKTK
jgi:DNA-directed RNA polymerase subunit RPC12/RpoP